MPALITARCGQGKLIITETHIIVERPGKSQTMARSAFTTLDVQGLLFSRKLTFHGQGGERLVASLVKSADANAIKAILTGR